MKHFSWVVLIFVGLLLLSVVIACRSSSSSEVNCTGEVIYEGRTFTGQGKNAEEAQQSACINYCLNADPEVEAHYGIWYESPKGKAAGHPPKKEAIDSDKELFDYAYKTCALKCVASIKDGKFKGNAKCP